jgi:hypothetical protein
MKAAQRMDRYDTEEFRSVVAEVRWDQWLKQQDRNRSVELRRVRREVRRLETALDVAW